MNRSNEPFTARWMTTGRCVVVVLAHVLEVEPLRRVVVELDRAQLPGAPDGVGHVEVDLGSVERAVARLELVRQARGLERRAQRALRRASHIASSPMRTSGRVANLSVAVSPNTW